VTLPKNKSHGRPTQELLFLVSGGQGGDTRELVSELLDRLAQMRRWQCGPPDFVDLGGPDDDEARGDPCADTIGGRLEVYSAMPIGSLPRELDLQALEDVAAFLAEIAEFSRSRNLVFEFLLDGNPVGKIKSGRLDRLLEQGLLGEWRRQIDGIT
jgi:hypothetical protein